MLILKSEAESEEATLEINSQDKESNQLEVHAKLLSEMMMVTMMMRMVMTKRMMTTVQWPSNCHA